jgi:hypothetical protein
MNMKSMTMMMQTRDKKNMMIMMICEVGSDDTDITGGAEGYGVLSDGLLLQLSSLSA